jgi:hypothetical protein
MTKFIDKKLRIKAVVLVSALAIVLGGCATADIENTFVGKTGCDPGPIVFATPDTSASTLPQRGPGGPYEKALVDRVVPSVAAACGTLYAAPADGDAIANAQWVIDDRSFKQIVRGNTNLDETARARKAKKDLAPRVRELLHMRISNGSDLLGVMQRVAIAARGTDPARKKVLILQTDGVIVVPGHISAYKSPLNTADRRKKFLGRLKRGDEIPDLTGFDVFVGGLGVGVGNRETAKGVIKLWNELIPMTGARLVSADSTLRYPA